MNASGLGSGHYCSHSHRSLAIHAEQASWSAKACGREPAEIERPLERSRQSEQDWRAILRYFIMAMNPLDYRWAPSNRRFISSGLYLPSVERSGVGDIVMVVDTSGSIGTQELEQFAGEINVPHSYSAYRAGSPLANERRESPKRTIAVLNEIARARSDQCGTTASLRTFQQQSRRNYKDILCTYSNLCPPSAESRGYRVAKTETRWCRRVRSLADFSSSRNRGRHRSRRAAARACRYW
jgi:hypothetical protein